MVAIVQAGIKGALRLNFPPPPGDPLSLTDRLKSWVIRHKFWSVVIALFLLFTAVGALANNGSSGTGAGSEPTTSAPVTEPPSAPVTEPPQASVPNVVGLDADVAQSKLEKAGFIVTRTKKPSHETPGTVLSISPSAGTGLVVGSSVSITVAQAFPTVPNVVGFSQARATSRLKKADYKVKVEKESSSQPAGTVLSTKPAAGTELQSGRTVTIVVAKPSSPSPTCTQGYSPCLVYHGGADYDCAGGSGDGPYYTKPGVTYHVTGSDPYGLDADGDGLGCE
jgi:resuscitation-promoting factor RpfB